MPWTVPALRVNTVMLVLGLHDITLLKCVDDSSVVSRVRIQQLKMVLPV